MRVALAVGEGEEAGAGGVEGFQGVGGAMGEVNDAHSLSWLCSLRPAADQMGGSRP